MQPFDINGFIDQPADVLPAPTLDMVVCRRNLYAALTCPATWSRRGRPLMSGWYISTLGNSAEVDPAVKSFRHRRPAYRKAISADWLHLLRGCEGVAREYEADQRFGVDMSLKWVVSEHYRK